MEHVDLMNSFTLVYRLLPRTIMTRGKDGFFFENGKDRGVLVRREHMSQVWYHRPEEYLEWKSFLRP